jgi:CRISPR-associated protein Csy1
MDPAIERFFADRKETWLKGNVKSSMDEKEIHDQERTCEDRFALYNWLPDAAKRARQMSLSTHPCTFSHPSARKNKNGYSSSVIARAEHAPDGLLRSGNVQVDIDALGNAAVLDVYKFLTLEMSDQRTLLTHIQEETGLANELLALGRGEYKELRQGFLAMVAIKDEPITSSKIKQVYFPIFGDDVGEEYHLLSVLTHSGHVFELRRRLDFLRFSEETKEAREKRKRGEHSDSGYQDIFNLTTIGYGGTKPQNISVMNNQFAGKAHLLLSVPPALSPRNVRLPKHSFFKECIYHRQLQETLQAFARVLKTDYNNVQIREGRDYRIQEYVDFVIQQMWQVRLAFEAHEYLRPESLPAYQKIWLFPEREDERTQTTEWQQRLVDDMARNFLYLYEKIKGADAIQLGDSGFDAVMRVIEKNLEALL